MALDKKELDRVNALMQQLFGNNDNPFGVGKLETAEEELERKHPEYKNLVRNSEYEYNPSRYDNFKGISDIVPPPSGDFESDTSKPTTLDTDYYDENFASAEPSPTPSDDERYYNLTRERNIKDEMQRDLEKQRFKKLKQKLKPIV